MMQTDWSIFYSKWNLSAEFSRVHESPLCVFEQRKVLHESLLWCWQKSDVLHCWLCTYSNRVILLMGTQSVPDWSSDVTHDIRGPMCIQTLHLFYNKGSLTYMGLMFAANLLKVLLIIRTRSEFGICCLRLVSEVCLLSTSHWDVFTRQFCLIYIDTPLS